MQIQDETGSNKRLSTSTYYNYDRIPIIYQLFTQQQVYVIKVHQVCQLPLLFALRRNKNDSSQIVRL